MSVSMEKPKDTKDRILISAKKLFGTSGFSAVSMSDIATDVGITKASLYHFFENKTDIYRAVVDDVLQVMETILGTAIRSGGRMSFADTVEAIIKMGIAEGNLIMQINPCVVGKETAQEEMMKAKFQQSLETTARFLGLYKAREPALGADVLLNAMRGYIQWATRETPHVSVRSYSEYLQELFIPTS